MGPNSTQTSNEMTCIGARGWTIWFSVGAAISAILTGTFPLICNSIIDWQLELKEGTLMWGMWKDAPVPMYINFYFFNILNTDDITKHHAKPILQEVGPYVFKEVHERINIATYPNGTMEFQQKRYWYFDEGRTNSSLSLNDSVTTLNVPYVGAAFVMRDLPFLVKQGFNTFTKLNGINDIFVTKQVHELLFDGYSDALLNMTAFIPPNFPVKIPPYDKFGWFYGRNGSAEYDGVFNVFTGVDDINKMDILDMWNKTRQTNFYESHCGMVNGSFGGGWPPYQQKTSISLYSSDLCRTVTLDYTGELYKGGVEFNRYAGTHRMFALKDTEPDNWCYCPNGVCPPAAGIVDSSPCRYGTPAFVSFPHFYAADDYYKNQFEPGSIDPDQDKHEFRIDLNPRMSVPLAVRARFQINMMVKPDKVLRHMNWKKEAYIPVIWFGVDADLSDSLLSAVWWGINSSTVMMIIAAVFCAINIAIAIGCGQKWRKKLQSRKSRLKNPN